MINQLKSHVKYKAANMMRTGRIQAILYPLGTLRRELLQQLLQGLN